MSLPNSLQQNLALPVIGSPMFIVSGPELVIAQCKAGVVGSFPALNARPQKELGSWLKRIKDELDEHKQNNPEAKVAPFAVNQICHATNNRLFEDMETCVEHEVPIIITSLRPPAEIVTAAHSYGGLVFHDVINRRHAEKAIEQGVDGLILVCAGAGGHAGTLSPFALVREVRENFDGVIILSGSIASGHSVASALALGADLAYIGTQFIATEEANANQGYKQMIVNSEAKDIVYTNLFSGVHGSYLRGSIEATDLDPDRLPEADKSSMNFGSGGDQEKRVWKDIWGAGQGVGQINEVRTVSDVVTNLKSEFKAAKTQFNQASSLFS